MDIKERILQYLEIKGITPTKVENILGWGKGSLIKVKSISAEKLSDFACYFNDVSAEWLVRGNGPMLIGNEETQFKLDFRHQKQGDFSAMDNGIVNVGDMEAANKAKMLSIVEKIVNSPNPSDEAMDKAMKILEKIVQ